MPIPRYRDSKGAYEIVLFCPSCAYSITLSKITEKWEDCPLCLKKGRKTKLEKRRIDYGG